MSNEPKWDAARASQPAISKDERALTEAAIQSLRDMRRARVANRQIPSQPKKVA